MRHEREAPIMIWNILSAMGSLLAAIVLLAASIAAVLQLKHLRLSNQLLVFLNAAEAYQSQDLTEARVWFESQDFRDPSVVDAACSNGGDPHVRVLGTYFDRIARLINLGLVDAGLFQPITASMPFFWKRLHPIALRIGASAGLPIWADFEYLIFQYGTGRLKMNTHSYSKEFIKLLGAEDVPERFARLAAEALKPPTLEKA